MALGLTFVSPAIAQAQNAETYTLTDAINSVSSEYGVVIVSTVKNTDAINVSRISQQSSIEDTMRLMLAGTNLEAVKDSSGSIVIRTKSSQETINSSSYVNKPSDEPTLGRIEEIVVTAQKTSKDMQDVAAAISAVNGDSLDKMNVNSIFDLSGKLPGLVMTSVQGYRPTVSIRGIGNEIPDNAGTKQAVAFHVDGIFMANDYALLADMFDVSRIEMTRGPDGTLYGNSSTGGAVNLVSKKPEFDETFGAVDLAIGTYQQQELKGFVNVPLSSELALRVSASHRTRDG